MAPTHVVVVSLPSSSLSLTPHVVYVYPHTYIRCRCVCVCVHVAPINSVQTHQTHECERNFDTPQRHRSFTGDWAGDLTQDRFVRLISSSFACGEFPCPLPRHPCWCSAFSLRFFVSGCLPTHMHPLSGCMLFPVSLSTPSGSLTAHQLLAYCQPTETSSREAGQ